MRKAVALQKVQDFEREFGELLPRSLPVLREYLQKKYSLRKLPTYRSPRNRHLLAVMFATLSGSETIQRRATDWCDRDLQNEFFASLAAPFDHLPTLDQVGNGVEALCHETDIISDQMFDHLLRQLQPRSLEWEPISWWLRNSLPNLTVVLLGSLLSVFILGGLFLDLQGLLQPLRILLPQGETYVSAYYTILLLLAAAFIALTIRVRGFDGLFRLLLILVAFPIYAAGKGLAYVMQAIYGIAFESFILEPEDFRLRGWLASEWFPVFLLASSIASALALLSFDNRLVGLAMAITSLLLLTGILVWYYHLTMHPLFFLEKGVRFNVSFRQIGIELDPAKIRQSTGLAEASRQSRIERLKKIELYVERMIKVTDTNRPDVFAGNFFVVLFLVILVWQVVCFFLVYAGLSRFDSQLFETTSSSAQSVGVSDLFRLSLNNTPIGGNITIRGSSLWIDLIMFAQRLFITLILVLAIFSYNVFSTLQLPSEKQRLKRHLQGVAATTKAAIKALSDSFPDAGTERGSRASRRRKRRRT